VVVTRAGRLQEWRASTVLQKNTQKYKQKSKSVPLSLVVPEFAVFTDCPNYRHDILLTVQTFHLHTLFYYKSSLLNRQINFTTASTDMHANLAYFPRKPNIIANASIF